MFQNNLFCLLWVLPVFRGVVIWWGIGVSFITSVSEERWKVGCLDNVRCARSKDLSTGKLYTGRTAATIDAQYCMIHATDCN